jgi:hypothetical protein
MSYTALRHAAYAGPGGWLLGWWDEDCAALAAGHDGTLAGWEWGLRVLTQSLLTATLKHTLAHLPHLHPPTWQV